MGKAKIILRSTGPLRPYVDELFAFLNPKIAATYKPASFNLSELKAFEICISTARSDIISSLAISRLSMPCSRLILYTRLH